MTDDDFLIEEVSEGMSALSADEEEDLLADVGGSSMDRLQTWELDSQISQPPASLPPQPASSKDTSSVWESPTEAVPASVAHTASVAALGAGRGASVLVVDPRAGPGDSPAEAALLRLGFKPKVCQSGSSTRDELSSGRYRLVFLRLDGEPTWARMLVSTAMQRWPHLRFVASLPSTAHDHMAALKTAGVADIVPEPLPDDARILMMMQGPGGNTPAPAPNPVMASRLATPVIPTPAVTTKPARSEPPRPAAAAAPASAEPSSDVTRLRTDLANAQRRAQDLETQLAQARADRAQQATEPASDVAAEVKALLTRHPYGPAMDQALRQMMAAVEAGQPMGADELGRYVKNLRSIRAALKKVEDRLGITEADYRK